MMTDVDIQFGIMDIHVYSGVHMLAAMMSLQWGMHFICRMSHRCAVSVWMPHRCAVSVWMSHRCAVSVWMSHLNLKHVELIIRLVDVIYKDNQIITQVIISIRQQLITYASLKLLESLTSQRIPQPAGRTIILRWWNLIGQNHRLK